MSKITEKTITSYFIEILKDFEFTSIKSIKFSKSIDKYDKKNWIWMKVNFWDGESEEHAHKLPENYQ